MKHLTHQKAASPPWSHTPYRCSTGGGGGKHGRGGAKHGAALIGVELTTLAWTHTPCIQRWHSIWDEQAWLV
jgi:hypothetical protein